ncbi:MAG TPA: baseplate J/gp47 family protein [Candidatus Aphodousia gallistercoris]|nr:baseplate J/gp47 family protein [Candidatus Aphodousia gallistercoris]
MIENPVFTVNEYGISAPTYSEILDYFQGKAREIFGQDINVDADTQDGQLIAIFAAAINDVNAQAIATYNQFNPNTAIGVGLDSAVKTNGIERQAASNSTVDLVLVGQAGTVIESGVAEDSNGNKWLLPDQVVIPVSGQITVTAVAQEEGAIEASPNTITQISTPTMGWQTVNNPSYATVGSAIETDIELRARQARSTELASVSLWEGIIASLLNFDGVTRVSGIKNDEDEPTEEGIPGHTIAMIVDGGEVDDIGKTIFLKKGEGVGTYGTTESTYVDVYGFPNKISFSRPTVVNIFVTLTIKPGASYLSTAADEVKERISNYINSLAIGEDVNIARVLASAVKDCDTGVDNRFEVQEIKMGESSGSQTVASIPIEWNEAASCNVANVTVTVNE